MTLVLGLTLYKNESFKSEWFSPTMTSNISVFQNDSYDCFKICLHYDKGSGIFKVTARAIFQIEVFFKVLKSPARATRNVTHCHR